MSLNCSDTKGCFPAINNSSGTEMESDPGSVWLVPVGVSLFLLSFVTFVGNAMVMHAFRVDKRLQTVSNMFIMSLASADLIVGLLVMPLGSFYAIKGEWVLGVTACRLWLIIDYTASTASILNLCILSLDRYWSITAPLQYLRRRTKRRALRMITSVWLLSSSWIWPVLFWDRAASALFGDSDSQQIHASDDLNQPQHCETGFAANWYFKLVTATLNFYLPWLWMMFLYVRMFAAIRRRSKTEVGHFSQMQDRSAYASTSKSSRGSSRLRHQRKEQQTSSSNAHKRSQNLRDAKSTARTMTLKNQTTRRCSSENNCTALVATTEFCSSQPAAVEVIHKKSTYSCRQEQMPLNERCSHLSSNRSHTDEDEQEQETLLNADASRSVIRSHSQPRYIQGSTNMYENKNKRAGGGIGADVNSLRRCHTTSGTRRKHNSTSSTNLILLREKKAAIQLSIIMGAFVLCWLPYSVLFVTVAGCGECVPSWIYTASIWLGYLNSALNPILYPLCNATFKQAFKNILLRQNSDSVRTSSSR